MPRSARPAGQQNPAIRLSTLRPRLDRLFAGKADATELQAELDRLTDGLKPESFLPLLVGAFASAPASQRDRLDEPLATWLRDRGMLTALRDLEARRLSDEDERAIARAWLGAGGVSPASEQSSDIQPAELVIAAYEVGDANQASVTLFWHEDGRRRRVRAASFLIDFQPPWEGALKDLAYFSFRDFARAHAEYFASWREAGLEQRAIAVTEATRQIWACLGQSKARVIRLPADFIPVKSELMPFLRSLPTDPDVATLSPDEITLLAAVGRRPEDLRRDEQRFGYQRRMADGSIVRIITPPDDW